MLEMKNTLDKLEKEQNPIKVAIFGIGKMGKSLTDRLIKIDGMRPSLIVNRHIKKAENALKDLGIKADDIVFAKNSLEVENAIKEEKYAISDDPQVAYETKEIDVFVEATGNPQYGAKIAYNAIKNKKHIVMLNVECDSAVGPILYKLANENGVVYTGAKGDEPAAILELYEFAMGLGFDVIAMGKGKNNPKDIHATNESVSELAKKKDICNKSLTSFVDATNTMIELNSVANATGFTPDVFGCHGIQSDIKTLSDKLNVESENRIVHSEKILDYVHGIAPGVFVAIKSDSPETAKTLQYVGMGDGPVYTLYRPFHLCSLETPISIYKAKIKNEATIAPVKGQVCDTVTFAKRDMKKGEIIGGIGSNDTYGALTTHKDCMDRNLLPIAIITDRTRLKRDVKKDELITYDMVELDKDEIITMLRFEQDNMNVQR